MNARVLAFQSELSNARALAAERRRVLDETPELTTEQILEGFKRELRSVAVKGFGAVYYYHPMNIAERLEVESKMDGGKAIGVIRAIIALSLNSDGSAKFTSEIEEALLTSAPWESVAKLAHTLVPTHRFALASAEKK